MSLQWRRMDEQTAREIMAEASILVGRDVEIVITDLDYDRNMLPSDRSFAHVMSVEATHHGRPRDTRSHDWVVVETDEGKHEFMTDTWLHKFAVSRETGTVQFYSENRLTAFFFATE